MASLLLFLAASLSVLSVASAEDARVAWMQDLPEWQKNAVMRLKLTAPSGEAAPLLYPVYPLTQHLGLNGTETARNVRPDGMLSSSAVRSGMLTLHSR